tara:strand:+ start:995 stop:1210 length:216 start_codon:yes stop_codon:yes gene_type:complete
LEKQLELFSEPKNELTALWEALEKVKISQDKVRKRLFGEVKDLQEQLVKVRADNERLKFHTEMKPTIRWSA